MNVQIVDLTPEYIDGALDVFTNPTCCIVPERRIISAKHPRNIRAPIWNGLSETKTLSAWSLWRTAKWQESFLRQKKKNPTLCFFTKDIIKFMTLPSAKLSAGKKSDKDLTTPSKQEPKPTTLPILNWRSSASIPAPWLFIINWAIRKFHRL